MLFDNIEIGNRLEISLKKGEIGQETGKVYVSLVEEMLGQNELLMHLPISYGQLVKLPLNVTYSLVFFTDKGMLRFDAVIAGYLDKEEFHFMKVQLTSSGERIQRREFFRMPCVFPLSYSRIEGDPDNWEEEGVVVKWYEGLAKDMGGGGLRFVANEVLEEQEGIQCMLEFQSPSLLVFGKVLQRQSFPKSNYQYQYRIQFVGITNKEREKIIQFIFKEQSKVMQKVRR